MERTGRTSSTTGWAIVRFALMLGLLAVLCAPVMAQPAAGENQPESEETTEPPAPPSETAPIPSLDDEDDDVPLPTRQTPQPQPNTFAFGQFLLASPRTSLASVPPMFGDAFFRGGSLVATEGLPAGTLTLATGVPLAAGNRRLKIAEHNMAVPVDRVYFNYNHFHNALATSVTGASAAGVPPGAFAADDDFSLDRYTLGIEKTFINRQSSIELRLPLAGRVDFDFDTGAADAEIASVDGREFGNLAVITKHVLWADACNVFSAGLGVDIPTGSDAEVRTPFTLYEIENDAVYLQPYLALTRTAGAGWFWHGFFQLDVPLGGNSINFETIAPVAPAGGEIGRLDDQMLLEVDLGGGRWLYRNRWASLVTGLAAILEVHLTTTLDGSDSIVVARGTPFTGGATLDYRGQEQSDVVNLTAGFHTQLRRLSSARVAVALPLSTAESDRTFDAEVIAQFSRRF